jgi:two-component system, sensor histidine kinase PdtaS
VRRIPASIAAMTERAALARRALRLARTQVLLSLAMVGLMPLATLVLLERAITDHMAMSLGVATALALAVMAFITWFADRQLLRPIGRLVRHLAEDRPSDFADPQPRWMMQVDKRMGEATEKLTADRIALGDAREMQQQLTREVHHRVKNNLQIVASLLNLHRRGATSPDAAGAFRTIQHRVDALTSVHRHLVSSGDGADRVGARQLVEDVSAIFGDPDGVSERPPVVADVPADLALAQDVALPVAFLLTELIELALRHDARAIVRIALARGNDTTVLTVGSITFADPACDKALTEGYLVRVLAGLSRQLRTELVRSEDRTGFTLALAAA